jgi:hypothetical protein
MLTSCQDEKGELGIRYVYVERFRDVRSNQANLTDTIVNARQRVVGQPCGGIRALHRTQTAIPRGAIHIKTPHPLGGSHPARSPALPEVQSEPRSGDYCCKTEQVRNIVGGVLSPLLSNIFLHYVLDEWFEQEVKPRLRGKAFLIRYADDFVIGFSHADDAQRVLAVLPLRFGKFGLALHPEKTRLLPFQPPSAAGAEGAGRGTPPGTFTLLGFTHYWGRSLRGHWVVKRKTASSRMSRALRSIAHWCRLHRHQPLGVQQQTLSQRLHGHYAYYGITGNSSALSAFRLWVVRCWRTWLTRRNRERSLTWDLFTRLLQRYPLPPPRVVHSVYARAASL